MEAVNRCFARNELSVFVRVAQRRPRSAQQQSSAASLLVIDKNCVEEQQQLSVVVMRIVGLWRSVMRGKIWGSSFARKKYARTHDRLGSSPPVSWSNPLGSN